MDKIKRFIDEIKKLPGEVPKCEAKCIHIIVGDYTSGKLNEVFAAYLLGQVQGRIYSHNKVKRTLNKKPTPRGWLSQ